MTDWRREAEDELAEEQAEYEELERDLGEDSHPPQGLHQRGWKPFGDPEPWEDEAVADYLYPEWDEL